MPISTVLLPNTTLSAGIFPESLSEPSITMLPNALLPARFSVAPLEIVTAEFHAADEPSTPE